MSPAIIVINGTSSTGKTTTARTLQKIFPKPLFYLGLDLWISETLCERFWEPAVRIEDIKHNQENQLGTHFLLPHTEHNPTPWPMVGSGPASDAAIYVMHQTAVDFYQRGYWVIIDHVFLASRWYQNFMETTKDCQRFLIKFTSEEAILEQREKARGNRMPNVFRALNECIHQNVAYDLLIDTSHTTPLSTAESIMNFQPIKERLS